jgi:hypothetical protein
MTQAKNGSDGQGQNFHLNLKDKKNTEMKCRWNIMLQSAVLIGCENIKANVGNGYG